MKTSTDQPVSSSISDTMGSSNLLKKRAMARRTSLGNAEPTGNSANGKNSVFKSVTDILSVRFGRRGRSSVSQSSGSKAHSLPPTPQQHNAANAEAKRFAAKFSGTPKERGFLSKQSPKTGFRDAITDAFATKLSGLSKGRVEALLEYKGKISSRHASGTLRTSDFKRLSQEADGKIKAVKQEFALRSVQDEMYKRLEKFQNPTVGRGDVSTELANAKEFFGKSNASAGSVQHKMLSTYISELEKLRVEKGPVNISGSARIIEQQHAIGKLESRIDKLDEVIDEAATHALESVDPEEQDKFIELYDKAVDERNASIERLRAYL